MGIPAPDALSSPTGRKLPCRSSRRDLPTRRLKFPSLTRCSICSRPAWKIAWWLRLGACWSPLTGKHGRNGKEPLMAGERTLIVVQEFERSIPQLHDRHVGRRTNVERAAIIEGREHTRCIDGRRRDHLAEGHAEHDEFRHHVREVNDTRILA